MESPNDGVPEEVSEQKALIEKAREGDLQAFGQLVRMEQDAVRAFLAVRLARTDEAEDLAQETFIRAFRELGEFDTDRPLRPWLIGIAHNLLHNHLRKFRAEPIGGNEELQVVFDGFLLSQRAERQVPELFVYLEECLAKLDAKAKEMIEARYIRGETIKEMRVTSGKGHSALTMYLHRIREVLGECLQRKMKRSTERS